MTLKAHSETITVTRDSIDVAALYPNETAATQAIIANTLQPEAYTLNIGKHLPTGGVNLAYVNAPKLDSNNYVAVSDYSSRLPIKNINNHVSCISGPHYRLYNPNTNDFVFPNGDYLVTDQWSIVDTHNDKYKVAHPLWYVSKFQATLNLKDLDYSTNEETYVYKNGTPFNSHINTMAGTSYKVNNQNEFDLVYPNSKNRINITRANCVALSNDEVYKIVFKPSATSAAAVTSVVTLPPLTASINAETFAQSRESNSTLAIDYGYTWGPGSTGSITATLFDGSSWTFTRSDFDTDTWNTIVECYSSNIPMVVGYANRAGFKGFNGTYTEIYIPTTANTTSHGFSININSGLKTTTYDVYVYTNFINNNSNTYYLNYYDITTNKWVNANISMRPLFTKVDKSVMKAIIDNSTATGSTLYGSQNTYALEQSGIDAYNIIVPRKSTVLSEESCNKTIFKYQISSALDTIISQHNPTTVRIGMYLLNANLANANTQPFDPSLYINNIANAMPDYVTLINPMADVASRTPNTYDYWSININAPLEVLNQYDIIIVAGYGTLNMAGTHLYEYVSMGGHLVIDSATSGTNAIQVTWPNSSATSVQFSTSSTMPLNQLVSYDYAHTHQFTNRFYNLDSCLYSTVKTANFVSQVVSLPVLNVGAEADYWNVIACSSSAANIVAAERKIGAGHLVMSGLGFSTNTLTNVIKLVTNMVFVLKERVNIKSPWFISGVLPSNLVFYEEQESSLYHIDASDNLVKHIISPSSAYTGEYSAKDISGAIFTISAQTLSGDTATNIQLLQTVTTSSVNASPALWASGIGSSSPMISSLLHRYNTRTVYRMPSSQTFKVRIIANIYKYINTSNNFEYIKVVGDYHNCSTNSHRNYKDLGDIRTFVPTIPTQYNNSDCFVVLRAEVVAADTSYDVPIELLVSNENMSRIYTDRSGLPCITLKDMQNSTTTIRLFVKAETEEVVNADSFAIKNTDISYPSVSLGVTTDERDCWFMNIQNTSFELPVNDSSIAVNALYAIPDYIQQNYDWYPMNSWTKLTNDDANITLVNNANLKMTRATANSPTAHMSVVSGKQTIISDGWNIVFSTDTNTTSDIKLKVLVKYYDSNDSELTLYATTIYCVIGSGKQSQKISIPAEDIPASATTFTIGYVVESGQLAKLDLQRWLSINDSYIQYDTNHVDITEDKLELLDDYMLKTTYTNLEPNTVSVYKSSNRILRAYEEILVRDLAADSSGRTYQAANKCWVTAPVPIIQIQNETKPLSYFKVDYKQGTLVSPVDLGAHIKVVATYSYADNSQPLTITSIAPESGIITVKEFVGLTDNVYADYTYKNSKYIYKGYYDETLGRYFRLDLNPSYGHFSTMQHVVNNALSCIETPSYNLIGHTITLYMLPMKYVVAQNASATVSSQYTSTTNYWTVRHSFESFDKVKAIFPHALHLANIQLHENSTKSDIEVIDTRLYGGGLKAGISLNKIEEIDKSSKYFWDISPWNGLGYTPNGVIVIRLPRALITATDDAPAPWTEADITAKLTKFLPLGTLPIIEYV